MIEEVSGHSRLELISDPDIEISEADASRFRSCIERRSVGEPVQHILGYTEFYGHRILVSKDALIPRPETEGLVELSLAFLSTRENPVILDVGTGTGCIAIALAITLAKAGSMCVITGVDVSEEALELASRNGGLLGVDVDWIPGDMYELETIPGESASVDLIVSNPPYIPESDMESLQVEVRMYEPELALTPGHDHLKPYRALAALAADRLRAGGAVYVEIEERFGPQVDRIFSSAGLTNVNIHTDLSGRDRVVSGQKPSQ